MGTKNTPGKNTAGRNTAGKNTAGRSPSGRTTAGRNEAPRSARERLQAEQAREERHRKLRRRLAVTGSAVLVLALAAGVGAALSGAKGGGGRDGRVAEAATGQPLRIPSGTSGPGGTVITYGDPAAKDTLAVYEDPRCPYCAMFEQANADTITRLADEGRFKVEYHLATFLDDNLGGSGSKRALNALGAAAQEGPAKFAAFHKVLYANHPDERDDAYADTGHLLDLAGKVPGLRTPEFDAAVRNLTYMPWVKKVSDAFDESGVSGTPTVLLNGKKLEVLSGGRSVTPAQFTAMVDKQLGAK
ncbi:hypothetical protein GCM10027168_46360 [Streptomyces capparidis]